MDANQWTRVDGFVKRVPPKMKGKKKMKNGSKSRKSDEKSCFLLRFCANFKLLAKSSQHSIRIFTSYIPLTVIR
jgi:hypothetical protein